MNRLSKIPLFIFLFLSPSCGQSRDIEFTPTPSFESTPTPSIVSAPTQTTSPTKTPTPTPIKQISSLSPSAITVAKANQVVELMRLGRGEITNWALSPKEDKLAVATKIGVWVYRLADMKTLHFFEINTGNQNNVAWSPDGTKLATQNWSSKVLIWDLERGELFAELDLHTSGKTRKMIWSPDGGKLFVLDENGVRVWDSSDGEEITLWEDFYGIAVDIAWTPGGDLLLLGILNGSNGIWNITKGKKIAELNHNHFDLPRDSKIFWSPDRRKVVTIGNTEPSWFDKNAHDTAWVWDGNTGEFLIKIKKGWHHVAWSLDGNYLAMAHFSGTVHIWESDNWKIIKRSEEDFDTLSGLNWTYDGELLVGGSLDREEIILNISTGKRFVTLESYQPYFGDDPWSPDGQKLLSWCSDGYVRIWDVNNGEQVPVFGILSESVVKASFSPDGQKLASSGRDNHVRIWDVEKKDQLLLLDGHTDFVFDVAWSPDGNKIASSSRDGTIRIWDAFTGKPLAIFEPPNFDTMMHLSWSPNGDLLTIDRSYSSNNIYIWDGTSGEEVRILGGHRWWMEDVDWSPDGKKLASGSRDNTVRVWDVENGEQIVLYEEHTDFVTNVVWSPDGTKIASLGEDHALRIWDAYSGETIFVVEHRTRKTPVSWSPDSTMIVFGDREGKEGKVYIWDVVRGIQIAMFNVSNVSTDRVLYVVWSPDGTQIAAGSTDGTIRIWGIREE